MEYNTQTYVNTDFLLLILILQMEVLQFLLLKISFLYLIFITWKNLMNKIYRMFVLISELCAFCL